MEYIAEMRRQTIVANSDGNPTLVNGRLSAVTVSTIAARHLIEKKHQRSNGSKHVYHSVSRCRQHARHFVALAVSRGISRVLCASNMGVYEGPTSIPHSDLAAGAENDPNAHESKKSNLRLGVLLCDLHFGAKYFGLYQRFFDQAARNRGLRMEWLVFNCLHSQYPSEAAQLAMDGFLVAGGPNTGLVDDKEDADASEPAESLHESTPRVKNNQFGVWRSKLCNLLRHLHVNKRTRLGALGLGHVILAEALGGTVAQREWEDGWNLLDPAHFVDQTVSVSQKSTTGSTAQSFAYEGNIGIKYLHGEYVSSMDNASKSIKFWRSMDQRFISCFRDKWALSFDGFPECGSFVFEAMSEMYDREKYTKRYQSRKKSSTHPRGDNRRGRKQAQAFTATLLTLDEKRRLLKITDASQAVAHALLEHFCFNSRQLNGLVSNDSTDVIAMLCSNLVSDVEESIRTIGTNHGVSAVWLPVCPTSDGHLAVLSPRLDALVVNHELRQITQRRFSQSRRISDTSAQRRYSQSRRSSEASGEEVGLSLQTLRNQTLFKSRTPTPSLSCRAESSSQILSRRQNSVAFATVQSSRDMLRRRKTVARRIQTVDVEMLTLSEALLILGRAKQKKRAPLIADEPSGFTSCSLPIKPQSVIIRLVNEECRHSGNLQPKSVIQMRQLWLQLVVAFRISGVEDYRVVVMSRQTALLDFLRQRQPLWRYIKDLRRATEFSQYDRLKKISWYARYVDSLLFDPDLLLSNSAKENEALFQEAHRHGLKIFIARKESVTDFASRENTPVESPRNGSFSTRKTFYKRSSQTRDPAVGTEGDQSVDMDMKIVEFMLLKLSGIHGIATSNPQLILEAIQIMHSTSPMMAEVEQLFRKWQSREASKPAKKRLSLIRTVVDPESLGDVDDPDDYIEDDALRSAADDELQEDELRLEMGRQQAEHGVRRPPSASYLPIRPLQPKQGNHVLSRTPSRFLPHFPSARLATEGSFLCVPRTSSIGTLKTSLQRSATLKATPLNMAELSGLQNRSLEHEPKQHTVACASDIHLS